MGGQKTRFIHMADTMNLEGEMKSLAESMAKLYEMVVNDHRDQTVCSGFVPFTNTSPKPKLDEALKKLQRREYNVGFAGVFSTGKSTLINALLDEPDFLPEALQPCTMSITLIGSPDPGTSERVEVKYYGKEQALRNIFDNFRYRDVAEPIREKILSQFNVETAVQAVRDMARELKEGGEQKFKDASLRASELEECVQLMDDPEIGRRLGTLWIDSLENAGNYLTRADDGSGMGHLLLIEQVTVFKDNPLFTRHGVRLIDLPGTDDVNERQKQLTFNYLSEADAVILLIQPRGFSDAAVKIRDELGRYTKEVRDKMFTVINMFDKMAMHELDPKEFEPWRKDVTSNLVGLMGLDIDKFFVTSALFSKLLTKAQKGTLDEDERKQLEAMREDLQGKLEQVMNKPLDPAWQTKVRQAFTDGGVPALRSALMGYLEKEIRIARLKDVFQFLKDVYVSFGRMLEPEFDKIESFISSSSDRRMLLHEFMERFRDIFYNALAEIDENLEENIAKVMAQLSDALAPGVGRWCDTINFSRLKMEMDEPNPSPYDLMRKAIKKAQTDLSKIFVDVVEERTAKMVLQVVKERLDATPIADIFKYVSKALGQDYLERWQEMVATFSNDLRKATRLRSMEEMWDLQALPIKPAPVDDFDRAAQKKFKESLKNIFGQRFVEYAQKLAKVLPKYDETIMRAFMRDFDELSADMEQDVGLEQDKVSLPMNLVTGEAEKQEKEYKLFAYWQMFQVAKKHFDKVAAQFEDLMSETG